MPFRKLFVRPVLIPVLAATVGLLAPAAAHAGPLVASSPDCAEEDLSRPFLPWADPAQYQFAPNGGFEKGSAGWSLSGGAGVVHGNESHYVHATTDSKSLQLPAGSTATSPVVCVGLEHPTVRLFARGSGSLSSTVQVEVLFEKASGDVASAPVGAIAGGGDWQPSAPMPVVANLLPLLPGEYTPVQFRFTALGGSWRIDDFYIDPMRRS